MMWNFPRKMLIVCLNLVIHFAKLRYNVQHMVVGNYGVEHGFPDEIVARLQPETRSVLNMNEGSSLENEDFPPEHEDPSAENDTMGFVSDLASLAPYGTVKLVVAARL